MGRYPHPLDAQAVALENDLGMEHVVQVVDMKDDNEVNIAKRRRAGLSIDPNGRQHEIGNGPEGGSEATIPRFVDAIGPPRRKGSN